MRKSLRTTLLLLCIPAGCAGPAISSTTLPTRPATRSASNLALERITPVPQLPQPRPSRVKIPPLEAIDLYARARSAMGDGERFAAIQLIEKAIDIDPDSYVLHYTLGELTAPPAVAPDRAVEAFENAAAIKPDDVAVHLQLGRLYLGRKNLPRSIEHLRLAQQTSGFTRRPDQAALVELFLARALSEKGYYQAAIAQYQSLLQRLTHATGAMRAHPEIAYLAARPALIHAQVGELYDALGEPAQASRAYESAIAAQGEGDFSLQARYIRALAASGRFEQSARRAIDLVSRFHARPDTIELLQEVYRIDGREGAVADELQALHQHRPDDRLLLFALTDILQAQGQDAKAEKVLADAATQRPGDLDLIRRLFTLYDQQNRITDAATLLLEALGAEPDLLSDVTELFSNLLRPLRRGHLRINDLQALELSPRAQGARWYWVSRLADLWGRDELARSALEKAVEHDPPFPPAYRELLARQWSRPDWDDAQKIGASKQLTTRAKAAGAAALSDELSALSLVQQEKLDQAADIFSALAGRADPSFDVQMEFAQLMMMQGKDNRAEQMFWKLLSDHPTRRQPYQVLFGYYLQRRSPTQAVKVLNHWLAADPTSVDARLLNASLLSGMGNQAEAMKILDDLLNAHGDDPRILESLQLLHARAGQMDQFIVKLETERARHPENRQAVEQLVRIYISQSRQADAERALDAMRSAVADDPDLLYSTASLYHAIGNQRGAESALLEVLKLDPGHPPANNDLAYYWTEDHRNLSRAEAMIRTALVAEPDNQSYLDSLGWVQYKRGNFDEARKSFEQAIGSAARPDPVLLDHLADTLYRLNEKTRAAELWRQSLARLAQIQSDRPDLKTLHLSLQKKLAQIQSDQPVSVAPIATDGARSGVDP